MKVVAVVLLVGVLLAVSVSALRVNEEFVEAEEVSRLKFQSFVQKFEKIYGAEEFGRRYSIFKDNLAHINELNSHNDGAVYEVTKFADLTPEEFKRVYRSPRSYTGEELRAAMGSASAVEASSVSSAQDIPDTVDWVTKGAVTPVKNQGQCGSCWAFSATGNIEGQWFLKKGQLVSLSEQNLVDCDKVDHGCEGGLPQNAYEFIYQQNGIDTEASYPYMGIDSSCKFNPNTIGATVQQNWTMLQKDETVMATWLASNGPISIGINAENLQFYSGGISDPLFCSAEKLDHGVLIVGYGTGKNWLGKEVPYWLIKNSWGENWGEKGYFRIIRGKNKCGVAENATSSIVA